MEIVNKVIIYCQAFDTEEKIKIIKTIRHLQTDLIKLLTCNDLLGDANGNLEGLINTRIKTIKDYVDENYLGKRTCNIYYRKVDKFEILYDIEWV